MSESTDASNTSRTSDASESLMSGESWDAFCDTLKSAGQTILAEGQPSAQLDRAEGFRYLSRLTRAPST